MREKEKIKPFQNESQVIQIDNLTIENRTDRISIYGNLDICRDKEGQLKAEILKILFEDITLFFQGEEVPKKITITPTKTVKNPFE